MMARHLMANATAKGRLMTLVEDPQDATRWINQHTLTVDDSGAHSPRSRRDRHILRHDLSGRGRARGARERATSRGRPIRRPDGGAWLPKRGRASWPHQAANGSASRCYRAGSRCANRSIALLQDTICI